MNRLLFPLSLMHTDRTEFLQKLRDYQRIARRWKSEP